ncbi:MAG: uroporphyrinogen decarboxylase family protein, partial [Polyangiales bacterium]
LPKDTPAIHFGTGNPELYPAMKEAGGDVIGIDWRTSIDEAWSVLGDDVGLQGNMDPAALLASTDVLCTRASEVLESAAGRPGHIFNLGHGIMPQATPAQARALVDHVHEASRR